MTLESAKKCPITQGHVKTNASVIANGRNSSERSEVPRGFSFIFKKLWFTGSACNHANSSMQSIGKRY